MSGMKDESLRMKVLSSVIDEMLEATFGQRMAFFFCVTNFGEEGDAGLANFSSNSTREDSIKWLEQTLERLKADKPMPPHVGVMQ